MRHFERQFPPGCRDWGRSAAMNSSGLAPNGIQTLVFFEVNGKAMQERATLTEF